MTRTVVLLRHAQTDENVRGRFNSTTDVGITEHGAAQATQTAASLAPLQQFGFVRSDARRARETAAPLAELTCQAPEVDPRFAEVDFGPYEGATPAALAGDPGFEAWNRGDGTHPGGPEPLHLAADRALAALDDALARHAQHPTLVVVAHGVLLRLLVCRAVLDLPVGSYHRLVLDNARAAVVTVGDRGTLKRLVGMNVAPADLDQLDR